MTRINNKSELMNFRIPLELAKNIRYISKKEKIKMSEIVINSLKLYISKNYKNHEIESNIKTEINEGQIMVNEFLEEEKKFKNNKLDLDKFFQKMDEIHKEKTEKIELEKKFKKYSE